MKNKNIIVAIDGHSSTGKSTLAKKIAKKLNFIYIDTGAMYRCVTLFAINNNLIKNFEIDEENLKKNLKKIEISFFWDKEKGESLTFLNNKNVEKKIRNLNISENVSYISKLKFVRERLVFLQREMSKKQDVILDGRDIGTVVFPNADFKFFITADEKIRAKRRYDELIINDKNVNFQEVLKNVIERDFIDENRKESPLKKAKNSIIVNNSKLNIEESYNFVLNIILNNLKDEKKNHF